jgi:cobalamin biosynthesis Mg chelatase CobN
MKSGGRPAAIATVASVVLFAIALGVTADAPRAGAHGETGTMAVEVRQGPESDAVEVRARVTYANDGDVAPGASVDATLTGPGGRAVPLTLADNGDGTYAAQASVSEPGTWTARLVSTTPSATAEATFTVSATATTTTTEAVRTPSTRGSSAAPGADQDAGDDDGAPVAWIVLAVVAALLLAGLVWWWARRRTRSEVSS